MMLLLRPIGSPWSWVSILPKVFRFRIRFGPGSPNYRQTKRKKEKNLMSVELVAIFWRLEASHITGSPCIRHESNINFSF
jgi:hypothetical protein